jgi:hypothetical protein
VNPKISKAFHDIRNTYSALYAFLATSDEEPIFTKEQIKEYLDKDVQLMAEAEAACKECGKGE